MHGIQYMHRCLHGDNRDLAADFNRVWFKSNQLTASRMHHDRDLEFLSSAFTSCIGIQWHRVFFTRSGQTDRLGEVGFLLSSSSAKSRDRKKAMQSVQWIFAAACPCLLHARGFCCPSFYSGGQPQFPAIIDSPINQSCRKATYRLEHHSRVLRWCAYSRIVVYWCLETSLG